MNPSKPGSYSSKDPLSGEVLAHLKHDVVQNLGSNDEYVFNNSSVWPTYLYTPESYKFLFTCPMLSWLSFTHRFDGHCAGLYVSIFQAIFNKHST